LLRPQQKTELFENPVGARIQFGFVEKAAVRKLSPKKQIASMVSVGTSENLETRR
jgi:hypothetical protein